MAAIDPDFDFDTVGLEDCAVLEGLADMVRDRASAVGLDVLPADRALGAFDRRPPSIAAVAALADAVNALAPRYVDMDFPYWDNNWADFPKMHSAAKIAADPDHSLSVVPQAGSTFDAGSLEAYRTLLKNIHWWLLKFRYVKADSWRDRTYRRDWSWEKSWDYATEDYDVHAEENGQTVTKGLQDLRLGGAGEDDDPNPSGWASEFTVTCHGGCTASRDYSHGRNTPLYQRAPVSHHYSLRGMPHVLTTRNPTAFTANLLWFIVPDGRMHRTLSQEEVTQTELWTVEEWGDWPNHFTANLYHSDGGTREYVSSDLVRGDWKETLLQSWAGTAERTRRTNWSSDGERSLVVQDDTETIPEFDPGSNGYDLTEDRFNTFGLAPTPSASEAPMIVEATILPHGSHSWTVCGKTALPGPNMPWPEPVWVGTDLYDLLSTSSVSYSGSTRWVAVLDLGEFTAG